MALSSWPSDRVPSTLPASLIADAICSQSSPSKTVMPAPVTTSGSTKSSRPHIFTLPTELRDRVCELVLSDIIDNEIPSLERMALPTPMQCCLLLWHNQRRIHALTRVRGFTASNIWANSRQKLLPTILATIRTTSRSPRYRGLRPHATGPLQVILDMDASVTHPEMALHTVFNHNPSIKRIQHLKFVLIFRSSQGLCSGQDLHDEILKFLRLRISMTRMFDADRSLFDGDDNARHCYDVLSWKTVSFEIRGQGNWVKFGFSLPSGEIRGDTWTLASMKGHSADGKWDYSVKREGDEPSAVTSQVI